MHLMDCSCALYCHFSLRSQMMPQQTAKFRTASFRHFRSTLRKDSIVNYGSTWTLFPPSVKRTWSSLQRTKRCILPSIAGATQFANFAAEIFQIAKKIGLRVVPSMVLHMVAIEIVINSTRVMGIHVTMSCQYCIAFKVMLLFLVLVLFRLVWIRLI